jgi:hypothetical protein
MIHNIAFRANCNQIQKRKQDIIKNQIHHEYKVGDQVLLETPGILRKLSTPRKGQYPATKVYQNKTIQFQKGIISERVNIYKITPFQQTRN